MKIVYRKHNLLLPPLGYGVINILGMLLFVEGKLKPISAKTWNHERIHSRQWREMLFVPFAVWYMVERLIKFVYYLFIASEMSNPRYKTETISKYRIVRAWYYLLYVGKLSYRNLSFEREAYGNDRNLNYLDTRKTFDFAWMKYIYRKGKISLVPSSEYNVELKIAKTSA